MPPRSRTLTSAVALAATAVVLAGCGNSPDSGQAPAAEGGVQLVADGKLTTCTHLPYEPFQFNEGGTIVGFDVELVDLVATKLGVTQEIVDTPFEGIQSGEDLNIGKCDVAAAAMTITETRKQNFDFSEPYFDATQALLVKGDAGITGAEQLAGKKVGVQNSTTGQEWAQSNLPNSELVVFEDLGLLTTAAQTGQVDAAINDNGPLLDFAKKNPEMAVTAEFDTGEQYGIGVKKGNTAVLEAVNEALATARSDGTYDKIYEKWFGKAPGA
ncbi:basic amino acid ABC transporter substrate-binding protein [Pseudonocardia lacus]|uniref:basic amino acid ABC transporter substrate-binding protein n=1 Tax=Pseudonocardia lacus TaxID=2835865 RepID=UPI0027E2BFF2|nr:basic amino acid ABC transporter substrate-binding protein [Pseudonocardia lacus]